MSDAWPDRQTIIRMRTTRLAFTMMELLTTFTLIAIIGLIAAQVFLPQRTSASDAAAQQVLEQLATRQELELTTRGGYSDDVTRIGASMNRVEIVTGTAGDGQISLAVGNVGAGEGYGAAYRLGDRCYTIRVDADGEELIGSFDATAVNCSADLALEGSES